MHKITSAHKHETSKSYINELQPFPNPIPSSVPKYIHAYFDGYTQTEHMRVLRLLSGLYKNDQPKKIKSNNLLYIQGPPS